MHPIKYEHRELVFTFQDKRLNWKPKFNKQQKKTDNKHTKYSEFGQFFGAVGPLVYWKFQRRALSIWTFFWDGHYKMIVPSTGRHYHWYISLINEASRANVLDFRTSNFQEAAIKPVVPRQGMPILKKMTPNYFFNFLDEWFESWHLTNEKKWKKTGKRPTKCSELSGVFQSVDDFYPFRYYPLTGAMGW